MTLGTLFYTGHAPQGAPIPVMHQHVAGMSRRSFLRAAGAAGGFAVASRWMWPTVASAAPKASATPRPIPEFLPGSAFDNPDNTHLFHILPPMGPQMGQYIEPITITDFKGKIGRCHLIGTGQGRSRESDRNAKYNFDVDVAFMQGSFVGSDGRKHHGTFGFL
jgi:hypothetical protein